MLRIPHCLDNRRTDGGKVASPTHPPHFTPQKYYYFYVSGTHCCSRLSKLQGLVRPEELDKFKKIASSRIEPAFIFSHNFKESYQHSVENCPSYSLDRKQREPPSPSGRCGISQSYRQSKSFPSVLKPLTCTLPTDLSKLPFSVVRYITSNCVLR
jgi:hypothetical protein